MKCSSPSRDFYKFGAFLVSKFGAFLVSLKADASSYIELYVFMFRMKFYCFHQCYYFLQLPFQKEPVQLNMTFLYSSLAFVLTLLTAGENCKVAGVHHWNLHSDFYCCPEAISQDMTWILKQTCNSLPQQFFVLVQGLSVICSSSV